MKHTLNYRLIALLAAVAAAIGVGVPLVHRFQVRRTSAIFLERAGKAGREGKTALKLDLLGRYLASRPGDVAALEDYGLTLAGSDSPRDRSTATEILERVLTRDPGRTRARGKAAELSLAQGQIEAARAHYEILAASEGGDAVAEEALGRCEEQLRRYPEAAAWLARAIEHDPGLVAAPARLARLHRRHLKNPALADAIMDAGGGGTGLIAKNPGSARAYLERASYRREFAIPGADEDVRRALGLAPDDAEVLLASSRVVAPAEAALLLDRGAASHPDDGRFYRGLAGLEAAEGRVDRAIERLKAGLGRLPGDPDLRWMLAEYLIDAGRLAEAAAEIGRLRVAGLPAVPLDYLAARVLVSSRSWTEAARQLARTAPMLESLPGSTGLAKRAFLMLAGCHARLGNPDMRQSAARRAVALEAADPALNVAARSELAAALAGLGMLDEAAEEYRIALRLAADPGGLSLQLARVLILGNLQLPEPRRRWDEAERILAQVEARSPGDAEGAVLGAEILAARSRPGEADERLRRAEVAHPDAPAPKVALAALAERRGRPGESLEILEGARKKLGDRPELLAALVRYWSSRPGESASRALAALAEACRGVPDGSGRAALLATVAAGLDRIGEVAGASAIRDGLVAEQPDHLGLRLAQLDAALATGDLAAARRVLDEVRRIEGAEGSIWRYARAELLIRSSRVSADPAALEEARTLLAEVRERRPGWAKALLASAELDDLRGDQGSALRGYLSAAEHGERDPGAIRRAVQLLYRRGRYAQADALLGRVQEDGPLSPELGRLAADVALQAHDDDRAIGLARRAVAGRPDSAVDQTWLGQLLFAASRKAEERGRADDARARRLESEKALARGAELAPADPDAQAALVLALAAWGRAGEAEGALRKAEGIFRGPAAELAVARCLDSLGRPAEAEDRYRAILRARPDDVLALQAAAISALRSGKIAEAEPRLRRLIGLRSRTPREAAWARRVLALALSIEQGGESSKARELLGLDDDSASPDPATSEGGTGLSGDDLRARAQVLALRADRSSRRKALAMIDALAARDEAGPSDLLLRARLLAAGGDWKRASIAGRQLLAEAPDDPTLLEFLARGQVGSGDPAGASAWIDALDRLRPDAPLVVELRARALRAAGKGDEAVALLRGLARKLPGRSIEVAGLLESLGNPEAAEAMLRGLGPSDLPADLRPDASLALAALLGRRGHPAEAVELCETLWADPKVDPSRVASVALAALYDGDPGRAVFERVGRAIASALARQPAAIAPRFDSANFAILEGRYPEAERILRDLRAAEPDLVAASNNLAWLLSLRGDRGAEPLDLIDRAIALRGPRPGLLDTRGVILTGLGQPERAVDDLEESIAAEPSAMGHLHLALALRKAGKPADAGDAMAKARLAGLRAAEVHPLERPAFLELDAAYPERR